MDAHKSDLIFDLEEIRKFEASAQRESVRGKLAVWRSQIEQELSGLQEKSPRPAEPTDSTKSPPKPKLFTKKITNYAWDQSSKFVKIFVSGLTGVGDLPEDRRSISYDGNHYTLNIHNLNNSNYQFVAPKLLHEVTDPTLKIKADEVVIMLRKNTQGSWDTLSAMEKKEKDEKQKQNEPKFDKNEDPSKGLMDMMRKMYDEGDDDMKRTIAKAWTESRQKEMKGEGLMK